MATKKGTTTSSKLPKRFTPKERSAILTEAKTKRMTGPQVAEKFGIAAITYYVWRQQASERGWYGVGRRGGWTQPTDSRRSSPSRQLKRLLARILREVINEELARW
jgi:transposase-like protein